jgi:hypothetical protein
MKQHILWIAILLSAHFYSCSSKQSSQDSSNGDTLVTVVDSNDETQSPSSAADTVVTDSIASAAEWDPGEVSYVGEQAIVYKTKKDFSKNVPVKMNEDKTKIVAYPSPKDLFYKDKLAYPTQLKNGYLLDNRGVSKNSVFIDMTYDDYSKLDQAPLLSDILKLVIDKDPFLEMYSLGTRARFKDEVKEINEIIERGALKKFRRIK